MEAMGDPVVSRCSTAGYVRMREIGMGSNVEGQMAGGVDLAEGGVIGSEADDGEAQCRWCVPQMEMVVRVACGSAVRP